MSLLIRLGAALGLGLLSGRPPVRVDIIGRYRIMSTQNEGGLTRLPVRHPLGALDGGLAGGCFGNSSILGGHSSKADSYQFSLLVTLQ